MKTLNGFLLALFCVFASSLSAQQAFRIAKVGADLSFDMDMVQGMGQESLLEKGSEGFRNTLPFGEMADNYRFSGICENPSLRLGLVLEPTFLKQVELHTNLNLIWNRRDAVGYYNHSAGGKEHYYIDISGSEIGVEAVALKRLGKRWFHAYGGLGVNGGVNFNNTLSASAYSEDSPVLDLNRSFGEMLASPDSKSIYQASEGMDFYQEEKLGNGVSARAFAQTGVGFLLFSKVELGINARYGYGIRGYGKGKRDGTNLVSFGASLRYSF